MPPAPIFDITLSDKEDSDRPTHVPVKRAGPVMGYFTAPAPSNTGQPQYAPQPGDPRTNIINSSKAGERQHHEPASHPFHRKRTAKEAFGRNGVTELLNLARASLNNAGSTTSSNSSTKASTPSRDSTNELSAKFSSANENDYLTQSMPDQWKRPRNVSLIHSDNQRTSRNESSHASKASLHSLIQEAEQSDGPMIVRSPKSLPSLALKHNSAAPNHANPAAPSRSPTLSKSREPSNSPDIPTIRVSESLGAPPRILYARKGPISTPHQYHATSALGNKIHGIANPSFRLPPKTLNEFVSKPNQDVRTSIEPLPPSINRARRFDRTALANRVGRPWTDAEIILTGFLYEVTGLAWSAIDKKMGRGYNACATKYCRIPTGLKNADTKRCMRWPERIRAIEALLATLDLDLEQTATYLQRYIETDSLPKEAAAEFQRLASLHSEPTAKISALQSGITARNSARASSASGSDSFPPVISTTRPRRYVDERAAVSDRLRPSTRAAEGLLGLKTAVKGRSGTPDSVFMSDQESQQRSTTNEKKDLYLFDIDVEAQDDKNLAGLYIQRKKPYLNSRERSLVTRAISKESEAAERWLGATFHYGFSVEEITTIVDAVSIVCPSLYARNPCGLPNQLLERATKAQLVAIAARAHEDERLNYRTRRSIKSFLEDAAGGRAIPSLERLRIAYQQARSEKRAACTTQQLLRRELGTTYSKRKPEWQIRDEIYDTMAVVRSFIGASGDVGSIAWSPSGTHFAAGAACLVDPSSMQYNRANNLLFGNIEQNTIYEIPDHHRLRTKPAEGINATHSMHVSQDPRLFETVSMVDFSFDGSLMFSVGYDNCLRAYQVDGDRGNCRLLSAFDHDSKVDLLSVNRRGNLLATGAADIDNGIKIFSCDYSGFKKVHEYYSPRAKNLVEKNIMPSCLEWGVHASVSDYLMAGFSSDINTDANATTAYGELCLWNIEKNVPVQVAPAAGNTFDCSWSSSSSLFATACAAYGVNINRGMRSLVRVYNPVQEAGNLRWITRGLQMECPALDINDILFNPYNQLQVAAGATDGTVYIWDLRNPDNILHRLSHGEPIMELDSNYAREAVDTGVRFCAWADRTSRMYSGSSDGVLKVWDVARSTEDALVKDVATFNSGIMSGVFTRDHSKLLIGEVNGSINLLEVDGDTRSSTVTEKFTLQPFEVPDTQNDRFVENDSEIASAQRSVMDGKIEIRLLGGYPKAQAVQGPAYDGPYDTASDAQNLRRRAQVFQNSMAISQHQCSLPRCLDSGRHFSAEGTENSGRSSDRIPQAMRDLVRGKRAGKLSSTMLKCAHCDAPARVREEDMAQAVFPLCERCSFGCLRCGKSSKISAAVDKAFCRSCGIEWDIGALGYTTTSEKNFATTVDRVVLQRTGDYVLVDEGGLDDMGDLLHLVEDYHHSLWEDRMSSEH